MKVRCRSSKGNSLGLAHGRIHPRDPVVQRGVLSRRCGAVQELRLARTRSSARGRIWLHGSRIVRRTDTRFTWTVGAKSKNVWTQVSGLLMEFAARLDTPGLLTKLVPFRQRGNRPSEGSGRGITGVQRSQDQKNSRRQSMFRSIAAYSRPSCQRRKTGAGKFLTRCPCGSDCKTPALHRALPSEEAVASPRAGRSRVFQKLQTSSGS